jgi:hypothetical protein
VGFVLVTDRALTKHNQHTAQIDRRLDDIEQEMAVIHEHCTASDDAFQEAVRRFYEDYGQALEKVVGLGFMSAQAKRALRRKLT